MNLGGSFRRCYGPAGPQAEQLFSQPPGDPWCHFSNLKLNCASSSRSSCHELRREKVLHQHHRCPTICFFSRLADAALTSLANENFRIWRDFRLEDHAYAHCCLSRPFRRRSSGFWTGFRMFPQMDLNVLLITLPYLGSRMRYHRGALWSHAVTVICICIRLAREKSVSVQVIAL